MRCSFMLRMWYFSSSSVVSRAFSALCVYLCAKFCFFGGLHCWASPCRKSRTQSITQSLSHSLTHPAYLMPRERKFSLWKSKNKIRCLSIKGRPPEIEFSYACLIFLFVWPWPPDDLGIWTWPWYSEDVLHIKNEVSRSRLSKVRAQAGRQTHRQINTTKHITT